MVNVTGLVGGAKQRHVLWVLAGSRGRQKLLTKKLLTLWLVASGTLPASTLSPDWLLPLVRSQIS